jgi:hypothetical protein
MCIDIPGELRDEDVAVGLVREYFADDCPAPLGVRT